MRWAGTPVCGPDFPPRCLLSPPSIDVLGSGPPLSQRRYRNWNPPLLGNLPDDFLRILPQQLDSIQVRGLPPTRLSASLLAHMVCASQFHFLMVKPRLSYFCCPGFAGKEY